MRTEMSVAPNFWVRSIVIIAVIVLLAALVALAWYFFRARREIQPHQNQTSELSLTNETVLERHCWTTDFGALPTRN